jgi:hypothetical protein
MKIFKHTLKNILISNSFYSVDEYISAKHVKHFATTFFVILFMMNVLLLLYSIVL